MKNYIIVAIIIILAIGGYFIYQAVSKIPVPKIQPEEQTQPTESFERIILSSHNWEAVGSTISIEKDGTYTVEFGRVGMKETRKGKLATSQLAEIINQADIFSLSNEYTGPKQTTRSWTQYNLIIETKSGSKSISFHSEDKTVPPVLHELVNKIIQLTKLEN